MPHMMKAVIYFPKWGLYKSVNLKDIIRAELYTPEAKFIIASEDDELCEVHEQACYAKFSSIEYEMKTHAIPFDIVYRDDTKHQKVQRSWRPGKEKEVEFSLEEDPAILTSVLRKLTSRFPVAVPSAIINTLCYEAETKVTPLKEWDSPDAFPILKSDDEAHLDEMLTQLDDMEGDPALSRMVENFKTAEADEINQDLKEQIRYVSQVMGQKNARDLLNDMKQSEKDNQNTNEHTHTPSPSPGMAQRKKRLYHP